MPNGKLLSIAVVHLSSGPTSSGTRIIPFADYFTNNNHKVLFLINKCAEDTFIRLLGNLKNKVNLMIFPLSGSSPGYKFSMGIEQMKRIFFSLFVDLDRDVNIIYSLTGLICDVFPSYIFKLKNKNRSWVANIDNIELKPSLKPGNYVINFYSYFAFRVSLFLLRKADAVIIATPAFEVANTLIRSGIKKEKIFVSRNGIPVEMIKNLKSERKIYGACYLGRIHKGKGVFDLVKIWKKITDVIPNIGKFLIIGSGDKDTEYELKKLIIHYKMTSKIELTGYIDDYKHKYMLMKKSKIFIFPSYYDSNPTSVIEALACRLPVLAYDLPIFSENYPKGIIQMAEKADVEGLAKIALGILKDTQKINELGDKGYQFAQKYQWEEILKSEEKVIYETSK